jgi:hypothetical protein
MKLKRKWRKLHRILCFSKRWGIYWPGEELSEVMQRTVKYTKGNVQVWTVKSLEHRGLHCIRVFLSTWCAPGPLRTPTWLHAYMHGAERISLHRLKAKQHRNWSVIYRHLRWQLWIKYSLWYFVSFPFHQYHCALQRILFRYFSESHTWRMLKCGYSICKYAFVIESMFLQPQQFSAAPFIEKKVTLSP